MKTMTMCILAFITAGSIAQPQWTEPVRITSGSQSEVHPAIANGFGWLSNAEELLAFSRNSKDICILRTTAGGTSWSDSLFFLTNDSADNDYPSLMRTTGEQGMLVWQGRRNGNSEILSSRLLNGIWSNPLPVTNNTIDDQFPHVAVKGGGLISDSTYYAVWEQQGRILISEYLSGSWSAPEVVSPAGDTLNHLPQVSRRYEGGAYVPLVVWQRKHPNDTSYAVMACRRVGAIWPQPDTLVFNGDNRRPRFQKYGYDDVLTWDQIVGVGSTTYGGYISISNGRIRVGSVSSLSWSADNQRNSSVNGVAIITQSPGSTNFLPRGVATWESTTLDSIGVDRGIYGGPFGEERLCPIGSSGNRNPTISQGTNAGGPGFTMRFWSVWESYVQGTWRLYGSNTVVIIDDVPEQSVEPLAFHLEQNYPNPFNPETKIGFRIREAGFVSLKVFDVLGREVATLVNEEMEPGEYQRTFNGSKLASGVYYFRLSAGSFTSVKKMTIIR